MKSIVYVGMDVHSSNYTLSSLLYEIESLNTVLKEISESFEQVEHQLSDECDFFHCEAKI